MTDPDYHVGAPPTLPTTAAKGFSPTARRWIGFTACFGALIIACCTGIGIGSVGEPEPRVVTTPTPVKVIEYLPAPSTALATSAAPAAPTKAPPATIEEGTWTVGEDFPAGTYKLQTAATSMCFWFIYKSGTNQGTTVESDIVTGGRPTVTLKRGHDFKSDCGTWVKVK